MGLSSILNSLSGFLGGVTGLSVGATTLCCPKMNDCLVEASADVLPLPLKLNVTSEEVAAPAALPNDGPKGKTGLGSTTSLDSSTGLGATTGTGEVAPKEKGTGFMASCSVGLSGVRSKENVLPPLIPSEGLGASIVDECVLSKPGVLSLATKVALGSVLDGLCDPNVKGRGDGED